MMPEVNVLANFSGTWGFPARRDRRYKFSLAISPSGNQPAARKKA